MSFASRCRAIVWLAGSIALASSGALSASAGQAGLRFDDGSAAAGIDFVHVNGRSPERHLPETMGAGVAWVDYDRDGDHDLYFVQSGPLPWNADAGAALPTNSLYRNRGDGTFGVVTAGVEDPGYGMGVTAGDYDDDGWADLYVTNLGADRLFRSNGDGTFSAVAAPGLQDSRWSASAAWGDLLGDGLLDLYVTRYVGYDPAMAPACGDQTEEGRAYCHIDLFSGLEDSLYRNDDGAFVDVARDAGVADASEGKGLGVVLGDLDDDGDTDIYVANDTQQNFLWSALGDGTFEDQGLFSGAGYSAEGKAQAGMGTDIADLDGDGSLEILVTNFAFEPNNLYRAFAPGAYLEESFALGLGEPGLAQLAFGILAVDLDADGDRDVAVANGHILDTVEAMQDGTTYPQRNHLFENALTAARREAGATPGDGWRPAARLLREMSTAAGNGFAPIEVSRGLAAGDADGDGRPELVFTNSDGPARLLANRSAGGNVLVLRLRGTTANRDAYGATATVTPIGDPADGVSGWPQRHDLRSGVSYLSQSASDLYVGLGPATSARVEVRWPDGSIETIDTVEAGNLVALVQGRAPASRPLGARR